MEAIDSLLNIQEKQEALHRLQLMDATGLNQADKSYYDLLLTMAQYKNDVPFESDSVINRVVDFYTRGKDKEMAMRSLVAQGCVNEELGRLEKAVSCYHQAEELPCTGATSELAYVKLRLLTHGHHGDHGLQTHRYGL